MYAQYGLAKAYTQINRLDDAEKLYKQCFKRCEEHYGQKHTEYAQFLCDAAYLYIKKSNFSTAQKMLQQALKILESKKHDGIYRCYEYWGDLYHAKGAEKQAQACYIKSFNYLRQHFPTNSAHVARLKSKIPFTKHCALFLKSFWGGGKISKNNMQHNNR